MIRSWAGLPTSTMVSAAESCDCAVRRSGSNVSLSNLPMTCPALVSDSSVHIHVAVRARNTFCHTGSVVLHGHPPCQCRRLSCRQRLRERYVEALQAGCESTSLLCPGSAPCTAATSSADHQHFPEANELMQWACLTVSESMPVMAADAFFWTVFSSVASASAECPGVRNSCVTSLPPVSACSSPADCTESACIVQRRAAVVQCKKYNHIRG